MKTKFLFIALALSTLGVAKNTINSRVHDFSLEALPPYPMCETSNITDQDGNILFSATCCKTFKSEPSAEVKAVTKLTLTICAEDGVRKVANIN